MFGLLARLRLRFPTNRICATRPPAPSPSALGRHCAMSVASSAFVESPACFPSFDGSTVFTRGRSSVHPSRTSV